jgi:hypothetical protein
MSLFFRSTAQVRLLALVCFCVGVSELCAQPKDVDQILFLHLRMKDGTLTLVRSATVAGVLKSRRSADKKAPFQLEVETAEGASLWGEKMTDPSVRRYEYEDPDNPGVIKSKVVQLNEVEFTVRVPFKKEARRLSFYRVSQPAEKGKTLIAPDAKSSKPAKELIARIDLPAAEAK